MGAAEKILIVDDEPQVLVALEDVLGDDFQVLKAPSADIALNILGQQSDIAVLLTDQRMPKMNGDQLLAQLQTWCKARRILVTGFADLNAVVRAVNDGELFAYVTKPWDPDDLILKVSGAASHFRLAQRLEHEQRLLHDLMDNSPDGIYFKDSELRFQRANQAFSQALGIPDPDNLLGRRTAEVLSDSKQAQSWNEIDQSILQSKQPKRDAIRAYPSTPTPSWISETIAPVCNDAGAALGLVGITRDVTERIRMEEALRVSEQRYREQSQLLNSILDSMGDGVVVADESGKLVYFNRRAEAILGAAPAGHQVKNWAQEYGFLEVDGKTPFPVESEPLGLAVQGKTAIEAEVCIRGNNATTALVALKATPLAAAGEAPRGGVALLRDITKQRQLELQVMQAQKMEAVGRLAGGIAHDFSNLLAVIQSYAELVMSNLAEGDRVRDDVQEILAASRRATQLTRQLLEFSRQRATQLQTVSINSVVLGMERMLRRLVGDELQLLVELDPELKLVESDPGQLEQVLMNLVINARDASTAGGLIRLSTHNSSAEEFSSLDTPSQEYVAISVSDTGTGMSPTTIERIFEPFFTTKGLERGTGLGLATVYAIVTQGHGHIRVASELGQGTTFLIYLPQTKATSPAALYSPGAAPESATGEHQILLVEADTMLRSVTARVLRSRGLQVIEAANAEEALEKCRGLYVHLLLVDTELALLGHQRLRDLLLSVDTPLRVLYLAGSGEGVAPRPVEEGERYLERPFAPSELADEVVKLLR